MLEAALSHCGRTRRRANPELRDDGETCVVVTIDLRFLSGLMPSYGTKSGSVGSTGGVDSAGPFLRTLTLLRNATIDINAGVIAATAGPIPRALPRARRS